MIMFHRQTYRYFYLLAFPKAPYWLRSLRRIISSCSERTDERTSESVLLEIFLPSQWCAPFQSPALGAYCAESKRRDPLSQRPRCGARRFQRRSAEQRRSRWSWQRLQGRGLVLSVDTRARYVAPRGSDRARRTTLARASLIIISGRFLDSKENLSRVHLLLVPFHYLSLSLSLSLFLSCLVAGDPENNLSHASRNSKRSPRARKTCRWNVTCRRLFRSRMTEVKGGSLVSTRDTYPGIQPRRFSHPG